jgi:hypothetical protein
LSDINKTFRREARSGVNGETTSPRVYGLVIRSGISLRCSPAKIASKSAFSPVNSFNPLCTTAIMDDSAAYVRTEDQAQIRRNKS